MHIALGAPVRTSDGHDIGTIDRLILDPRTHAIRSAVVHKGFLLTRDVEVPISQMTVAPDGVVQLSLSAARVDELPEFFEANYTSSPPPGSTAPADLMAGGVFWPVGYGAAPIAPAGGDVVDRVVQTEIDEALRRQDLENAVVGQGAEIKTRDGQKVGTVHQLVFDPETSVLTRFVVRSGFIFTEETDLPASLIASADDGVLRLRVDAAWFRAFRDLRPGLAVWTSDDTLLGTITRQEGNYLLVTSLDERRWTRVPITRIARMAHGKVELDVPMDEVTPWLVTPGATAGADTHDQPA
jgi:sporulation protein YlmC with PRC-barrel domain